MSEYFYHPLSAAQSSAYPEFPQYFDKSDYNAPKQLSSPNDFDTFIATTDVNNLSVEQFDNDLDTSLATWNIDAELQLLPADTSDLFRRIRTETPTCGGPSTIHSESASGYDTGYTESAYDPAYGSTYGSTYQSDASAYSEIDMNLQALGLANREDCQYMTSPISPNPSGGVGLSAPNYSPASSYHRGSFSDYEPQTHMRAPSSSSSDYYPHSPLSGMGKYTTSVVQATVSPANVSTQLPSVHSVMSSQRTAKSENVNRDLPKDSKRKYQCPSCPRGKRLSFSVNIIMTNFIKQPSHAPST